MKQITDILVEKRRLFFVTAFLLVLLSLFAFPLPRFTGELSGFDLKHTEQFRAFEELDSIFGQSSRVYLLVQPESDNRKAVFEGIDAIKKDLTSKSDGITIVSPKDFYKKLNHHWKKHNNSLHSFFEEGSEVPVLRQLIGKDMTSFLIIASFSHNANPGVAPFESITKKPPKGIRSVQPFSSKHIDQSIEEHIRHDFVLITLLILGFFGLYALLVFRKIKAIVFMGVIILIPVSASVVLFYLFGVDINLISVLVFPIVLILALSDSLHLLTGYVEFKTIADKGERTKKAISHYLIPSFYSSATTAAAFFSFYLFNDSQYIREFGLITSIALMLEFLIAFCLAPWLLPMIDLKQVKDKQLLSFSGILNANRKFITYACIALLGISVFFVNQLQVKSETELFFPKHSEIRQTHDELIRNFYSTISLNIVVKGPKMNAEGENPVFSYAEQLSEEIRKTGVPTDVVSGSDRYSYKTAMGLTINLFNVLGDKNPYYNFDHNAFRIEARFASASDILAFRKEHLDKLLANPPEGMHTSYSSLSLLMEEVNESVSTSLIQSLSTSGIFIFLMILLMTRSLSASLLSLLPNLVPIGFVVLIYVIFGLPINIITALTAVIALGLLDDDTVHILYRKLWLKEPMKELSFSILSSAILLIVCFSFFTISSFEPVITFGWVSALIFAIGVLCELTMMQWVIGVISNIQKQRKTKSK